MKDRRWDAVFFGMTCCILLGAQPAPGQDGTGTGAAIVRVVTEPEFVDGGNFTFSGTPGGVLVLVSGQESGLTASGLAAGNQVSKLSEIDPQVEAAGYELTEIRCDDLDSPVPSEGKLESSAAIFRIEESEVVTCEFVLTQSEVGVSGSRGESLCLKEGRWNAQNLEGKMDCRGAFVLNRKLKPVKDNGVILVLEDDCSRIFGDSTTKKEEDMLMIRVEGNLFQGVINGEEEGIDMVIDVTWTIESPEHVTGEMSSSTSQMGITCDLYRPFELTFDKPLTDKEYEKWEKRIRKKVEQMN